MLVPYRDFQTTSSTASFFADTSLRSNYRINMDYADETALFQKLTRYPFDKACNYL